MSDRTLTDLDTAVRAHLADQHPGQYVTSWVIATASTTDDDSFTDYDTDTPTGQPAHVSVGLLDVGRTLILDTRQEEPS